MGSKPLKVYVCGTFLTELTMDQSKLEVYASIKNLKKDRKCWKECGIISLELKPKTIRKGKW